MKAVILVRVASFSAVMALLLAAPLQSYAGSAHSTAHSKKACKTIKVKTHKPAPLVSGQNEITLGIHGGNIQPWSATIQGDGSVTTTGWEKARNQKLADPQHALAGLFKLADAEGFFSMPAQTNCSGANPDVATRYITMDSGSGSKQVDVHGTCVQNFNELYAVLENEVDLQH